VSPAESGATVWAWVPDLSGPALAAVSLLAVAILAIAGLRLSASPGRRGLSVALRLIALVPLALALAGLARAHLDQHTVRRTVLLLVDGSTSMGIREGGARRIDLAADYLARSEPALGELSSRAEVVARWIGDPSRSLSADELSSLPPPDGLRSDYLAAIDAATAELHPAAVVLLGDGADRGPLGQAMGGAGADGVRASSAGIGVPVYTVAFGGDVAGDLAVRIGAVAPFAFVRRPIQLPVAVEAGDEGPAEVTLSLVRDGEEVAARTVTLDGDGRGEVSFEITPDQVGYLTLEATVPAPAADPIPGNNSDAVTLRVIRDRTRVLQLAGHPSWDVRYLRRFLKTDPNIDLISFYILRDAPMFGAFRAAPISLIEFPHEQLFGEDLAGFDLVVMQNFSFQTLPGVFGARNRYAENLIDFVRDGGALLVVGGDGSFGAGEPGPLDDVLPVERGTASAAAGGRLEPTTVGNRHPVMQLAGDEESNRAAWSDLPELGAVNGVGPVRDGGIVLATAGEGAQPVLAVRQLGKGRVMTLASDGSWRWALEGEGHAHTRLWRNAVRWLVRDEEDRRLEVRPHAENMLPGEAPRLACRALTAEYAGRTGAELDLRILELGGEEVRAELSGVADGEGIWIAEAGALPPGTYLVELTSPSDPDALAEARFTVRGAHAELASPDGDPDLLRALSEGTGGSPLDPGEGMADLALEGLVERKVSRRIATPAWNRPWWLLAAALPLALDWFLRRRWGA